MNVGIKGRQIRTSRLGAAAEETVERFDKCHAIGGEWGTVSKSRRKSFFAPGTRTKGRIKVKTQSLAHSQERALGCTRFYPFQGRRTEMLKEYFPGCL